MFLLTAGWKLNTRASTPWASSIGAKMGGSFFILFFFSLSPISCGRKWAKMRTYLNPFVHRNLWGPHALPNVYSIYKHLVWNGCGLFQKPSLGFINQHNIMVKIFSLEKWIHAWDRCAILREFGKWGKILYLQDNISIWVTCEFWTNVFPRRRRTNFFFIFFTSVLWHEHFNLHCGEI